MEIITTGEEVLQGQIVDGNAAWLAEQLNSHGLDVQRRTTVGDRLEDLVAVFLEAAARNRVVIVNGGLGPTSDDLTAAAAARAAGLPLVEQHDWLEQLQARLKRQGGALTEAHRRQARLPRGAETIPNPVGSACGFWLDIGPALFCFTPGPPVELKPLFSQHVLPRLLREFGDGSRILLHRLQVFGCPESAVAEQVKAVELPPYTRLGYRPHLPTLEVKIISRGQGASLENGHRQAVAAIRQAIGDFVYAENGDDLPAVIHRAMQEQGHSLALAESCTAGWAAGELARQAGVSAWLKQGWVVYSAEAKIQSLGVPAATIERHGVISRPVAEAMARGARTRAGTTLALAITGQSGPVDANASVPAGMACIALAHPDGVISAGWQHRDFGRNGNRKVQVWLLLDLLRRYLNDLPLNPEYRVVSKIF